MFQRLEQTVEGDVGVAVGLVEQGDELRADDGTSGIVLCGFEGLGVGDAETDHTGIAQVHRIDAAEVFLFGIVEGFLRTSDGGGGHHVDEAVGMVVDETDALLAGLGGDEHDDAQVVAIGDGFHDVQVVVEGEVGDDGSADTCLNTRLAELLDAVVQDGVEVAHQHEGNFYLVLDGCELGEEFAEGHTVSKGLCGGRLDDGTIGQRVAERDAYLNHRDASALHRQDDVGGAFEGGTTGTEIERQEFLVCAVCEKGIDFVHCCDGFNGFDGMNGLIG